MHLAWKKLKGHISGVENYQKFYCLHMLVCVYKFISLYLKQSKYLLILQH